MLKLSDITLPVLLTTSVLSFTLAYYVLQRSKRAWCKVSKVCSLVIHPIKSAKGVQVSELTITKYGVQYKQFRDRSFVAVDSNNCMMNLNHAPKLITVKVSFSGTGLLLEDQRGTTISVPMKTQLEPNDSITKIE